MGTDLCEKIKAKRNLSHKTDDDLDRQPQLQPFFLSDFVSDYLQQHPKDDFACSFQRTLV